jgi:hypothetical protein
MRRFGRWMAVAAAVLAAGCGGDRTDGGISPTGPMLLVGPTATVVVNCPTQMEPGQTGTCVAYGYDSNGTFTNSNVSSWTSSNTGKVTITSGGAVTAVSPGASTITAVIDGISGNKSITVIDPTPVVTIYGPSSIRPNTTCEWYANVSVVTPGYTADWSGGTTIYEDEYSYLARKTTTGSFYVTLTVTDDDGRTATASKYVNVSSSAPACLL